jgi:hypothetical protein
MEEVIFVPYSVEEADDGVLGLLTGDAADF